MTQDESKTYVPALGFASLSPLYDPMIARWSAARKMRAHLIETLALEPGQRILELGAGPGRLSVEIKQQNPEVEVHAADIDPGMLKRARRNAARAAVDIHFHQMDVTQECEQGKFDRIYSTMTFHHLSPEGKLDALRVARAALSPGGAFLVSDFTIQQGISQKLLFSLIQQPLDGFENTTPHSDGRFQQRIRETFNTVHSSRTWRTVAGTIELFVCRDP